MTPQFRELIFSLPLDEPKASEGEEGKEEGEKPQKWNIGARKFRILKCIQNLFAEMQESNIRATSTEQLTKAFGWENNEAMQQQDVHELNRKLVEALEQSLLGTDYSATVPDLFCGVLNNVITCNECGESRQTQDRFLDLGLQVKGLQGVQQSLDQLFAREKFEGDNQLTCDAPKCGGVKTDSQKGPEIGKAPPVITLCLYRFELDYETWQRKKVNDRFEYPLELDISKYMSAEAV